jgi:propionyl-CoA synthetase
MPGRGPDAAWLKLGAEPGLCAACQHAKINETRRGTAYLRCTRAAWDSRLPRYPRLPVTQCVGFEPTDRSLGVAQEDDESARGDPSEHRGDERNQSQGR